MDWNSIVTKAANSFAKNVNTWLAKTTISKSTVNGPNAELPPGFLSSEIDLKQVTARDMQAVGIEPGIAKALAGELSDAWLAWSKQLHVRLPGAFPALAAVPARQAPPTTASRKTVPLRQAQSSAEDRLGKGQLLPRLNSATKETRDGDSEAARQAMTQLADWLDGSFKDWKQLAALSNLKGSGNVPTFAPPYVPVGPVIGGKVSPGKVGLFSGPRFGRTPRFG